MIQIILECTESEEWQEASRIRRALEIVYPEYRVLIDAPL